MRRWPLLVLILTACGCQGTVPPRDADPAVGLSAILVRGRVLLPSGEIRTRSLFLNLESNEERYRIPVVPDATTLYGVEPGVYHLYPVRDTFGAPQYDFIATVDGKTYRIPFPRDILRRDPLIVKPKQIYSVGILEVRILPGAGAGNTGMAVTLDDRVETRRRLVQDMIHRMMDPNTPAALRDATVAWTGALDDALAKLLGAKDPPPAFKPSE